VKICLTLQFIDGVLYHRVLRVGDKEPSYQVMVSRSDRKQVIQDLPPPLSPSIHQVHLKNC